MSIDASAYFAAALGALAGLAGDFAGDGTGTTSWSWSSSQPLLLARPAAHATRNLKTSVSRERWQAPHSAAIDVGRCPAHFGCVPELPRARTRPPAAASVAAAARAEGPVMSAVSLATPPRCLVSGAPSKPYALDRGGSRHLMAAAHLPTTAKDGFRTHGLTAARGHAESAKQMVPSPLARDITAGTTTSSTRTAANIAAAEAAPGFAFVISFRVYARPRRGSGRPGFARSNTNA